jgi:hypothetical protein
MYRHSQLALGFGVPGAIALHLGGTGVVWAGLLGATVLGMLLSVSHIAGELGLPHAAKLLDLVRGRPGVVARITPCLHCGKAHA